MKQPTVGSKPRRQAQCRGRGAHPVRGAASRLLSLAREDGCPGLVLGLTHEVSLRESANKTSMLLNTGSFVWPLEPLSPDWRLRRAGGASWGGSGG
eukprot:7888226-Alexandrium_andersonii.AAC.1